ncbi:MAG TPA: DegT/DnrJ/EryC1/StrS family aminotransferase [Anaerolineales bacterium]|nr:DegT/DnrJ/EryC1/StrS family aminotransferase [Anaerolineales bacterium]
MKIQMSSPDLTDAESAAVLAVLKTPILSMGHWVQDFERAFVEYTGRAHAIAVSSGTTGLHLSVRSAGIGAGDLVVTTPFSFVASTNVLLYEGAIPVFVDVDPLTGNMDPALVTEAAQDLVHGGTRAARWLPRRGAAEKKSLKSILAVDVFGQPADLDPLRSVAQQHGLGFIEDACEALGAEYKNRLAGTFGDTAVFAFYPNKQITTGEGGLIVTDDTRAADLMRALRNQGRAAGDTWLQHTHLGYNYRLDEMSAAVGMVQMSRLQELLLKRERVAEWYRSRLAKMTGVRPPTIESFTTRMSWFVYVVHFDASIDRDALAKRMTARGIPVRPYFLPIHLQPYMVERFGFGPGDFPHTEDLGRRGLALPFSGVMTEDEVEAVCQALNLELGAA